MVEISIKIIAGKKNTYLLTSEAVHFAMFMSIRAEFEFKPIII